MKSLLKFKHVIMQYKCLLVVVGIDLQLVV